MILTKQDIKSVGNITWQKTFNDLDKKVRDNVDSKVMARVMHDIWDKTEDAVENEVLLQIWGHGHILTGIFSVNL
jgi:hypothetical protein